MKNATDKKFFPASAPVWRAKAAAWLHDPGEKQLILFRRGHESGNVRRLRELLLGGQGDFIREADHWAAAADRPQFDFKGGKAADVRFWREAELIHPLAGLRFPLQSIAQSEEDLDDLEEEVFGKALAILGQVLGEELRINGAEDLRRALLALWRFLPEKAKAPGDLGELWRLLPADSRVPDHSIWTHLDLTSAIAGAFAADESERLALLTVSLGPVQDFIAQARSTSDLWAGSHLLSHLALAAMAPLLARFGPDAVIFPHLRGVPQLGAWLVEHMGIPKELFDEIGADWRREKTDFNPLFVATLPNLFVAIVPHAQAEELARASAEAARAEMKRLLREEVLRRLCGAAGIEEPPAVTVEQVEKQLDGFPEVHWAAVPWAKRGEDLAKARKPLEALLKLLTGAREVAAPGIFGQDFWQAFAEEVEAGIFRYRPNPGLLYPAVYSALTRVQAAAKAVRPFAQTAQEGFRCTLCGEREWLTTDREHLHWTARERENNRHKAEHKQTLWWRIIDSGQHRSWVRRGDHLCAICAAKRLWPDVFKDKAQALVKDSQFSGRFVVSTHTLALADDLEKIITDEEKRQKLLEAKQAFPDLEKADTTALPRRLMTLLGQQKAEDEVRTRIKQLPAHIDDLRNPPGRESRRDEEKLQRLLSAVGLEGHERYYALLLMDGDRMGAWIAAEGAAGATLLPVRARLHRKVAAAAEQAAGDERARAYLASPCPPSPARHVSISAALNGFALDLVRVVVEEMCNGKLVYAGGDDVMAMLTVEDALKAALALRVLYSGHLPAGADGLLPKGFTGRFEVENGFVRDCKRERLYMTMGPRATASAGLVIAHYLMPLSRALAELRATEKAAKAAGRNALAVRVLKRSGSVATAVGSWPGLTVAGGTVAEDTPFGRSFPGLLARFAEAIREGNLSRRVAYHSFQHIERLPARKLAALERGAWNAMLEAMLVHQFRQQAQKTANLNQLSTLAHDIAAWACDQDEPLLSLREFLGVAEFLARRTGKGAAEGGNPSAAQAKEDAA